MGSTKQKQPPKNIPILTKWKYNNNDGSISGIIYNSNNFPDGDSITTSSINNNLDIDIGDVIVQTSSGTRYFLQGPSSATGSTNAFSFFGSSKSSSTTASSSSSISTQQQTVLDDKRIAAAAAEAAAEKKRAQAETEQKRKA